MGFMARRSSLTEPVAQNRHVRTRWPAPLRATSSALRAEGHSDAHPVGHTRADNGGGETDRQLVYAGDAASRDDEAVADDDGGEDEAGERTEVAELHAGGASCSVYLLFRRRIQREVIRLRRPEPLPEKAADCIGQAAADAGRKGPWSTHAATCEGQ